MRFSSRAGRALVVAGLVGALVVVLPSAAWAKGHHPHGSTTTTTTGSSGSSQPTATLAIKPASLGHVTVEAAGTTTFEPGTNGEALHVGDTIKTDSVGLAEIDYATDTYTRLDVNTTFTITKLTDSEGNRQVNGTLQSGQTWNRTVALTQSESFDQQGGGTTAAVAGTAFVVDCTTPTTCTFTGVIDTVTLTGSGGQTQTLNPLGQCLSTSGNLCTNPSTLTPDQLALLQWIQQNVFLDFIEHGLGNGIFDPFGGTVNVTNGVVQTFTPSTPDQGFTPTTPPTPPAPPVLNDISAGDQYLGTTALGFPDPGQDPSGKCAGQPGSADAFQISTGDDCSVDFVVNVLSSANPVHLQILLPTDGSMAPDGTGLGTLFVRASQAATDPAIVSDQEIVAASSVFTFYANDITDSDTGTTSFVIQAVDDVTGAVSAPLNINVQVTPDCDDNPAPEFCSESDSASSTTSTAPITTTPTTTAPTTTAPTTTAPTTTTPTTTAPTS